jgi:hypothetical protein
MSCEVFISYSQGDKKAAEEICSILEHNGIGCWIAPRNIAPGSTWANSIVHGIESCRAMLLLCSANTNASRQMSRELQLADERRLPIVPARLSSVEMTGEYSYYLNNTQWLDLFPGEIKDHTADLITSVGNVIGQEQVAAAAAGTGGQAAVLGPVPRRAGSVSSPPAVRQKSRMLIFGGGGVVLALLAGFGIWQFGGFSRPPATASAQPGNPGGTAANTPANGNGAPLTGDKSVVQDAARRTPVSSEKTPVEKTPVGPLRMPAVLITGAAKHPNGYWVSAGPVTAGEYKEYLLTRVRGRMPEPPDSNPGWANDNSPMVNITRRQASEFCQWVGGHLPESTEMQPAALKASLKSDPSIWEAQEANGVIKLNGSAMEVVTGRSLPAPDIGFRCLAEVVP